MEIIADIASLRARLKYETSVAFVPTMGNLHAGHVSLIRIAQQHARCTVVSIFVNRLQFAPHEDFDRYPRTRSNDCRLLEESSVDVVFMPDEQTLYPVSQEFQLLLPVMAETLEGVYRPGFFRGVATVVLKLLNIVQPHVAVFGEKDYQQLQIVRRMADQLNLPVQIIAGETIRAGDGLALSSRNHYLDAIQRQEAVELARHLRQIRDSIASGERDFPLLEQLAIEKLSQRGWMVDYIAVRQQDTLLPASADDSRLAILGAARLGQIRLIDNFLLMLQ
ncbi:pantoate--beta-alanine ligase [Nitrosomonas sp.]|uniref:pantoate--beta-alanine ligase n=1 Tax=Nitrosomonas sp. TaxID=42353 RepID=UPI0025DDBAFD|nr:pantoate--beta-alanine ligase [Nitrosomonas sp.]MCC6917368.1 pantoate--beta-alanine ligase [Nitrosomonas sp.]